MYLSMSKTVIWINIFKWTKKSIPYIVDDVLSDHSRVQNYIFK